MTVAQLIAHLQTCDPTAAVVIGVVGDTDGFLSPDGVVTIDGTAFITAERD